MFRYAFKAEFVTLASLKSPVGYFYAFCSGFSRIFLFVCLLVCTYPVPFGHLKVGRVGVGERERETKDLGKLSVGHGFFFKHLCWGGGVAHISTKTSRILISSWHSMANLGCFK